MWHHLIKDYTKVLINTQLTQYPKKSDMSAVFLVHVLTLHTDTSFIQSIKMNIFCDLVTYIFIYILTHDTLMRL